MTGVQLYHISGSTKPQELLNGPSNKLVQLLKKVFRPIAVGAQSIIDALQGRMVIINKLLTLLTYMYMYMLKM